MHTHFPGINMDKSPHLFPHPSDSSSIVLSYIYPTSTTDPTPIFVLLRFVVLNPVGVIYDRIRRVKVGQQIQRAGSAVPAVQLVEHLKELVFDGADNLLAERVVDVRKGVKGECRRIVGVPDGRCFGAGRAGRDGGRCAWIERGDDSCGREGGIAGSLWCLP